MSRCRQQPLPARARKSKSGEALQSLEDGRQDAAHCSSSGYPAAEAAPLKGKGKKASRKALKCTDVGAEEVTVQPQHDQQEQKARVVQVVSAAEAPALAQFQATPRAGWWGARRFASAGKPPAHPRCHALERRPLPLPLASMCLLCPAIFRRLIFILQRRQARPDPARPSLPTRRALALYRID